MTEKKGFSIFNLFRKKTPIPFDMETYQIGIQEKPENYYMTTPILYNISNQSAIHRTVVTQLKNEIFRRGYEWKPKFYHQCKKCGKDYENPVEECSECGAMEMRRPDLLQLKYINTLLNENYTNASEQLFIDILKEMEEDLNIVDDAYMILVKEYFLDGNSEVRMHRVKEMYRGDPVSMFIYADEHGERGTKGFTCLTCRDVLMSEPTDACHTCGTSNTHPVHYVNRIYGGEQYFIDGEVLHFSKYAPSRLYGSSPVITLFNHITSLIAMENYVNQSYTKARMPRGLLAVQTRNMDSMRTFWRSVKEKMEQDAHFIPVMGIEAENGKGSVEWIKFMDSLKEMDYISVKEDLRDRIAAFYGVSKIFMADNSTSGGLNNEGMQILVTNRAVEMAQNVWNQYVFPWMTNQFGILDWKIVLPPSEEEDDIARMRKREIEVNIASQIKNLGFEVDMDEDGKFIFKKQSEVPEQGGDIEADPYAGTDIDTSQLGQMQEAMGGGGAGGETRNKPSMSVGPPNRNTGLPEAAANNNVDRRTERRIS